EHAQIIPPATDIDGVHGPDRGLPQEPKTLRLTANPDRPRAASSALRPCHSPGVRLDRAWSQSPRAYRQPAPIASCAQSWEQIVLAEVASWLLSTLAGAMITTAGVVFSLTVVSLQLASGQFSPRVMRSFVRDRLSQVVIGLLVATFVFCVLTLRHVSADPAEPAPSLTLTFAVLLAVTTVLLIIAHLNHLAGRLQVGEVVRAILEEGETT